MSFLNFVLSEIDYDESRIFSIEAILEHKQVACMRKKNAVYYFQIYLFVPEIFKFLKYAN